jgi:hypothetical protein
VGGVHVVILGAGSSDRRRLDNDAHGVYGIDAPAAALAEATVRVAGVASAPRLWPVRHGNVGDGGRMVHGPAAPDSPD